MDQIPFGVRPLFIILRAMVFKLIQQFPPYPSARRPRRYHCCWCPVPSSSKRGRAVQCSCQPGQGELHHRSRYAVLLDGHQWSPWNRLLTTSRICDRHHFHYHHPLHLQSILEKDGLHPVLLYPFAGVQYLPCGEYSTVLGQKFTK